MKELFLLKMTYGLKEMEYDFIPYWYGPFSPGVYADIESLKGDRFVQSREGPGGETFSLSPDGVKAAADAESRMPREQTARVRSCKERWNSRPLGELVAYVYDRWPKFTTRALQSPKAILSELKKEAKAAGITEDDVAQAIAEYRAQASTE